MKTPRALREQFKTYKSHGFNVVSAVPRAGSHWAVNFAEFPQMQIITAHVNDPRALKNNIARYRVLARQAKETKDVD